VGADVAALRFGEFASWHRNATAPLPAVVVEVVEAVADTPCLTLKREFRCDSGSAAVHHTGIKLLR
jgi:hypothetical protein